MARVGLPVLTLFALAVAVGAAEPESLPPPRSVAPALPPPVARLPGPVTYQRVSDYEHWQYYGVTRSGRFRPLVVTTPDGNAYYRYNGAPYPYAIVHPLYVMPYATN